MVKRFPPDKFVEEIVLKGCLVLRFRVIEAAFVELVAQGSQKSADEIENINCSSAIHRSRASQSGSSKIQMTCDLRLFRHAIRQRRSGSRHLCGYGLFDLLQWKATGNCVSWPAKQTLPRPCIHVFDWAGLA